MTMNKKVFGIFLHDLKSYNNFGKLSEYIIKHFTVDGYIPSFFNYNDLVSRKKIDVVLHTTDRSNSGAIDLNEIQKFIDICNARKIPRLVVDTGFFNNNSYQAIGYNGSKRHANYFNKNSPSDRFDSRNIKIHPIKIKKSNKNVLFFLQTHGSGIYPHSGLYYDEVIDNCIIYILNNTDFNIKIKTHPSYNYGILTTRNLIQKFKKYSNRISYYETIPRRSEKQHLDQFIDILNDDIYCTVSFSTNAIVRSIISGIPNISLYDKSIGWDVSNHSIEEIHNLTKFSKKDVYQWCCDLAYADWTIDEIKSGLPFKKLLNDLDKL